MRYWSQPDTTNGIAFVAVKILPPHVYYTWRYRSFGSSANNHLLGELAGLVLAVARWPSLARMSTSLDDLRDLGKGSFVAIRAGRRNREQALGYHLFSLEFCWQTQAASRWEKCFSVR
jgi:hypothetical protein